MRRVKPAITRSLINAFEHVDLVISSKDRPQENTNFRFVEIHQKLLFIQIEKVFAEFHCIQK